uniref:Ankyrin repeat domain 9 n=1 Tax=Jaculus jaculus TaxID=51337 RepID=A0A8C5KJE7_JACJA
RLEAWRCRDLSMPWDARPGGAEGGPEGAGAARLRVQKQCRKSSFAFYQAVRDLLPVWLLEDMRASEAFHWDERGRAAAYSPSEALLYALVHDHQAYAHYLLATFPRRALAPPSLLLRQLGRDASSVSAAVEDSSSAAATATAATTLGEPRQRRLLLLDLLALYTPAGATGPARRELLGDRLRWQRLLGEDKFQWLAGLAPPSLFARAMQVLVTTISPGRFPEALDELPLPPFLQPLDLTGKG